METKELKLKVEKVFEEKKGNKKLKKFKVYPTNDEDEMDLEDVEQIYEHLVEEKKIKDEDILINGVLINGFTHIKGFNEIGLDMERTSEYFSNRVIDVEKFTNDIQFINIYIRS